MTYITLIAVAGILLLQMTGSIPASSVGGPMVIGYAFIIAGLAVGLHEAWRMQRGAIGWIVNIIVAFIGVFVASPIAGMVSALILTPFSAGRSLAATGGLPMMLSLAIGMTIAVFSAWGALKIVNRWR